MNKREFLAVGGAVPLILAGCGSGSGSAPVRLVNASVGYPLLGFMDQSTQATTADVAYGAASPFETVQAGAVSLTLTVSGAAAAAAQTRTISKDQRYSLVAYGSASAYTQITTIPQSTPSAIQVLSGTTPVFSFSQTLALSTTGNTLADIFTGIVVDSSDPNGYFFSASALSSS